MAVTYRFPITFFTFMNESPMNLQYFIILISIFGGFKLVFFHGGIKITILNLCSFPLLEWCLIERKTFPKSEI